MAYKEGHDIKDNVARLNQEYTKFSDLTCCTCSYCIKKKAQPTVSFSNFRSAGNIGQTQHLFPQGEFPQLQYTLDYDGYSTKQFAIVDSFLWYYGYARNDWTFSEPWSSPQAQETNKFAKSLKYYNYRNCTGSSSSLFDPSNSTGWGSPSSYQMVIGNSPANWIPSYGTNDIDVSTLNSFPYDASFVVPFGNGLNYLYEVNNALVTQYFAGGYYGYGRSGGAVLGTPVVDANGSVISIPVLLSSNTFINPPGVEVYSNNGSGTIPRGTGFIGIGVLSGRTLTSISITNPGSGYDGSVKGAYLIGNQSVPEEEAYDVNLALSTCLSGLIPGQNSTYPPTLPGRFVWYEPASVSYLGFSTTACTESELNYAFGAGSTTPKTPPDPINAGNYQSLFNYMSSHDVSYSVREGNSCGNNVQKIFDCLPAFNALTHQYLGKEGYIRSTTTPPSGGLIGYPQKIKDRIISGGYVLSDFDFDFSNGSFYVEFGLFSKKDFFATMYTCSSSDYLTGPVAYGYLQSGMLGSCTYSVNYLSVYDFYTGGQIVPYWWYEGLPPYVIRGQYSDIFRMSFYPTQNTYFMNYTDGVPSGYYINASLGDNRYAFRQDNLKFRSIFDKSTSITSFTDESGETSIYIKNILATSPYIGSAQYVNAMGNNRDVIVGGKVPLNITSYVDYGFYFDAEIKVQSTPLCKSVNIPDRFKRINRLKVNFSDYKKIPQINNTVYDVSEYFKTQSPNDIGQGLTGYEGMTSTYRNINDSYSVEAYSYGLFYNDVIFTPPDVNQDATFYVGKKYYRKYGGTIYNSYGPNGIIEDVIETEEFEYKEFTIYAVFNTQNKGGISSRVYDSSEYDQDFANCILVNAPSSVLETGNELKLYGSYIPKCFLPLPTGSKYFCIFVREVSSNTQPAGTCLIRVARTLQDAIDGKAIKIFGPYPQYYSTFKVKYKNYLKDVSLQNAPRYTDFNTSNYQITNPRLDALGVEYTNTAGSITYADLGEMELAAYFTGEETGFPISFVFSSKNINSSLFITNNANFSYALTNPLLTVDYGYDYVEYISLAPLKVKYTNVKFYLKSSNGLVNFKYDYDFKFVFKRGIWGAAIAQAIEVDGKITSVAYIGPNGGYTVPPTVRIYSSSTPFVEGSFTAVLGTGDNSDKVVSITINDPGSGYYAPIVSIASPPAEDYFRALNSVGNFGFMCDITIEEDIDEDQQYSLPASYNQILDFKRNIQTRDDPLFGLPVINPEICEHIGKVIDRKNCNCPKQWVRLCDVHGKTDWKNCMQCKDFKVSE